MVKWRRARWWELKSTNILLTGHVHICGGAEDMRTELTLLGLAPGVHDDGEMCHRYNDTSEG